MTVSSRLSPDCLRYAAAARGERVARPFHYRWLIPTSCGRSERRWKTMRAVSLFGLLPAGAWYAGWGWEGLFVAAVPVGLAGVWSFYWYFPLLVDPPAMLLALTAAAAARDGLWPLALLLALVAGCTKETAPVFAALWAWNPLLLVGLAAPAVRHLQKAGTDDVDAENTWILNHPIAASRKYHKGRWSDPKLWILPWGVLLVGFAHPTWQVGLCVLVAYGQTLIATDTVRLYQWAWPVLALNAVEVVPAGWFLPLLLVHLANPYAGDGL